MANGSEDIDDPAQWRLISLEMPNPDCLWDVIDIRMLRPLDWIGNSLVLTSARSCAGGVEAAQRRVRPERSRSRRPGEQGGTGCGERLGEQGDEERDAVLALASSGLQE